MRAVLKTFYCLHFYLKNIILSKKIDVKFSLMVLKKIERNLTSNLIQQETFNISRVHPYDTEKPFLTPG